MLKENFVRLTVVFLLESLLIFEPLAATLNSKTDIKTKGAMKADERVAHALNRLSFGARPGEFERVRESGVDAYIEQQLQPEKIDDSALEAKLAKIPTLSLSTPAIAEQYNPPKPPPTTTPAPTVPGRNAAAPQKNSEMQNKESLTNSLAIEAKKPIENLIPTSKPAAPVKNPQQVINELQKAKLLRAVYSNRQLNEVLVDFWENHFSIYANKDSDRLLLTGFDRETVRPLAFGRFRDLLGATAHSPAMLYYLDNWQSRVERKYPAANGKPARKDGGINENYARELMELHSLGVDGGYTQKDVQEVARCFTGWTIRKPNEEGLFFYNPAAHDNGEKFVLGQKIPAGGGISDGERVLDILARHPSTARFIATKLARRFISDNPPASVVNKAAQTFLKTDGSIRETLRAIITSPEFFAQKTFRGKIRSPFEYVVASLRALDAETDAGRPVLDWIAKMGEPIFGHITPEGFTETGSEWLSNGSLLARFNFAVSLADNKIKGTHLVVAEVLKDIDINDRQAVAAKLEQTILENNISRRTRDTLAKNDEQTGLLKVKQEQTTEENMKPIISSAEKTDFKPNINIAKERTKISLPIFVDQLIALVIGSEEFQRR